MASSSRETGIAGPKRSIRPRPGDELASTIQPPTSRKPSQGRTSGQTVAGGLQHLVNEISRSNLRLKEIHKDDKTPTKQLTWVNVSEPSEKKKFRKEIRSHAITYAHSQRRKSTPNQKKNPAKVAENDRSQFQVPTPLFRQHSIWNHDPFLRLPVELTPEIKEALHIISLDERPVSRYFRYSYFVNFTAITTSEAAFYSSLAIIPSTICMQDDTPAPLKEYYERIDLQYASKAMKRIRAQIATSSNAGNTSEGLVSAVAALHLRSQTRNDPASAALHFDALEKIIKIRGGLSGVNDSIKVLVVHTDMIVSCAEDTRPRLSKPEDYLSDCVIRILDCYPDKEDRQRIVPSVRKVMGILRSQFPRHDTITDLLEDIAACDIAMRVMGNGSEQGRDGIHEDNVARTIFMHHILSLLSAKQDVSEQRQEFDEHEGMNVMEVLRLALLVFVVSNGKLLKDAPYVASGMQRKKLRSLLDEEEEGRQGGVVRWEKLGLGGFRMWVTALCLVESVGEEEIGWWRAVVEGIGVKLEVVEEMLWLEEVQGRRWAEIFGK